MKSLFIATALALVCANLAHAKGDPAAGQAKSAACVACHGPNGLSTTPGFPILAGQNRDFLLHVLKEYKSGKRKNPIMSAQVANLSKQDLADLAAFFSVQKGLVLKY
jgi:cytochrome c553